MPKETGITNYSAHVPGEVRNHHRPLRFDYTDGFIGIQEYEPGGQIGERVLLSPKQWRELLKFVQSHS